MKQKINKNGFPSLILIPILLLFISCGGDEKEEAKSMTQIQSEEGIPVKVEKIKFQPFTKYLSYFAKLEGIRQTTEGAAIGGRIEKVNFHPGDKVNTDDVIVQFPTDSPGSQYEQAKAAYENSKKTYERLKTLLAAGETSQAAFDGVETKYLVDKSNYETVKQMLFSDAPYEGFITEVNVNEGDNVKSKDPLFTIAQLDKMKTRIRATESEINLIHKSMNAVAVLNGKKYSGNVTNVSLSMDPYTQAFYAEIEFPNPNYELKSGLTYEINIVIYNNPNAIIIPRNLVMQDADGSYVFVEKNSQAVKKYIKNGRDSGLNYEVKDGLKVGENLIVKGNSQLKDGTKVKVIQ